METTEAIYCPFCGQKFEVSIDTTISSQRLTVDCEVCCRPLELQVECEPGEVLSIQVDGT